MIVTLKSADDLAGEKVIVDPNQIDAKGLTSMDFFVPSLDGSKIAVSMSEGGSESGNENGLKLESSYEMEREVIETSPVAVQIEPVLCYLYL